MNKVPKMISTKDLDYLSDMLNWNYFTAKKCFNDAQCTNDEEIKKVLNDTANMHLEHYKYILNILSIGG